MKLLDNTCIYNTYVANVYLENGLSAVKQSPFRKGQRLARRRERERYQRTSESEEARERRLARRRERDRNLRASGEREENRERRLARVRARRTERHSESFKRHALQLAGCEN